MTSINIQGVVLQLKIQKTRQYEQTSMTYHRKKIKKKALA
jgi:hypothetical protein